MIDWLIDIYWYVSEDDEEMAEEVKEELEEMDIKPSK